MESDLSPDTAPRSLRSGFAWTVAGNTVHGASQWALLSLIAKLGDARMLGAYAYALSLVLPFAMLAHLNLRAVLATDASHTHPLGDYMAVRNATTMALMAVAGLLAAAFATTAELTGVILLVAASLATENTSDVYFGALQRRQRLDQVSLSMIVRGILSVIGVGVALAFTRNLVLAMIALVAARFSTLLFYDRRLGRRQEEADRYSPAPGIRRLFLTALPLGVVLMLVSFAANAPRYAVEHHLGPRSLGAYAATASFITVGTTLLNALGQSAVSPLAHSWAASHRQRFWRLGSRVIGVALGLGLAGILGAYSAGTLVLSLVYRPEYAAYRGLLIQLMVAAAILYVAVALGSLVTSTRSFRPQMPLLGVVAAVSAAASWTLVPVLGISGAALAIASAAAVQCVGEIWILRRAMKVGR